MPAQCQAWTCSKDGQVDAGGGYAVTLWHAGRLGDYTTRPVLELSLRGVAVQWVLAADGYGWSGSVSCAPAGKAQCVLVDGQGAHSGYAQAFVVRSGRLVAQAKAVAVGDTPTVTARDLDGDGYLDVVVQISDYTPNYAQGHLYWRTYRYDDGEFVSTGCAPRTSLAESAPTHPLIGSCPARQ